MGSLTVVTSLVEHALEVHTARCLLDAFAPLTRSGRSRRAKWGKFFDGDLSAIPVTRVVLHDLEQFSKALCVCKRPIIARPWEEQQP